MRLNIFKKFVFTIIHFLIKGWILFYLPKERIIGLFFFVFFLNLQIIPVAYAQLKENFWKKPRNFLIYPQLSYTPETAWAGGVSSMAVFRVAPKQDSSRSSLGNATVLYTQNKQFIIQQNVQIFTPKEKNIFRTNLLFSRFPEYYFGIGDNTPAQNKELVDYIIFRFEGRWLKKIYRKWFTGLQYRFVNQYDVKSIPQGLLDSTQITGYQGGRASGLGLMLVKDSRDNVGNAHKGSYIELTMFSAGQWLGSQFNYQNYKLDARKYISFKHQKTGYQGVWAFQFLGNFVLNDAPYKQLSELGGESIMRGYYRGRYRDRNLMAFQTEVRLPLIYDQKGTDWVGMALFSSIGNVFGKYLNLNNLKIGYGVGLRLKVNTKENLNLRLDYARGNEKNVFYLEFTEAF